jgi:hypothetical protein
VQIPDGHDELLSLLFRRRSRLEGRSIWLCARGRKQSLGGITWRGRRCAWGARHFRKHL